MSDSRPDDADLPEPARRVLDCWFEETDRRRWFAKDDAFDREIERRFGPLLHAAKRGELQSWRRSPLALLALVILLDQFSRNVFRGTPAAFEADPAALALTLEGIDAGFDRSLTPEQRQFFYLPLMHAEDLAMQRLSLEKTRELVRAGHGDDRYARGHLELIERFGRFPHRNAILGRRSTPEEAEFVANHAGY